MINLTPPLTDEVVRELKAGDEVLINGIVYTARDAAHKRLVELLDEGKSLPIDVKGQIIYYVGPSPARAGKPIGSAGPTTAYRMDAYAPRLLEIGLKGMIGKGERGENVVEAMKKHGAVYFASTGGAAALIAKSIVSAKIVAYEDLGPEAIRELEVKDFPAVVAQDSHGNNVYVTGKEKYKIA
ncbi:Fe-S-containing hydro-lyase [candidate division KSB1 bacterium]